MPALSPDGFVAVCSGNPAADEIVYREASFPRDACRRHGDR